MNICRQEQIGEGCCFPIPRYNLSLSSYKLSVLYSCGDIFAQKKERKNKDREEQVGEGSISIPRVTADNSTLPIAYRFISNH